MGQIKISYFSIVTDIKKEKYVNITPGFWFDFFGGNFVGTEHLLQYISLRQFLFFLLLLFKEVILFF